MPCRYYTDAEERQMALNAAQESEEDIREMQEELEKLTRVACNLAGFVPSTRTLFLEEETLEWLKDHARKDFERDLKQAQEKRMRHSTRSSRPENGSTKDEASSRRRSLKSSKKVKGRKRSSNRMKDVGLE